MSIQLLFEPLELFILKSFSDTFNYYPSINIYYNEENKFYIDKWLNILYPNLTKNIINIEKIKDTKKNHHLNFDLYQIFQKVVSKNIKLNLKNIYFFPLSNVLLRETCIFALATRF